MPERVETGFRDPEFRQERVTSADVIASDPFGVGR
jgi:hypothetical protein